MTIQQMGGDVKTRVIEALERGAPIQPVTVTWAMEFARLLESDPPLDPRALESPERAWTNYYRRDDVCAVAYFYLDRPENALPALAPGPERIRPCGPIE